MDSTHNIAFEDRPTEILIQPMIQTKESGTWRHAYQYGNLIGGENYYPNL